MLRVPRYALAAASITFTFVGCQDATAPHGAAGPLSAKPMMSRAPGEQAPLVWHVVVPQATAPEITWVPAGNPDLNRHYVWLDTTARGNPNWRLGNPKLLVFMPGTRNVPASWQLLEQEAARLGYHVIGLVYQNDIEVIGVCTGSPDPNCSGNMRLEILEGVDSSDFVDVKPQNSIDYRLAKLLAYLDTTYSDEGWSRFLEQDGTPKWSQIAVSGQSQGAGQAALIGKLHQVDRVVMFSGPPDARVPGEADPWVAIGETPAAKYFALFHQRDRVVAGIRVNLAAFDMERFGEPVLAEDNVPPYGETHILVTNLEPQPGCTANCPHQSTAKDGVTPLGPDGKTPLLRDAWRYLLGEPPHGGAETVVAGTQ